jgi:nucleoside 2-deoxyribosyltransferase
MSNAKQDAFVICPMGKPGSSANRRSNELLDKIVKPALERFGLKAECFLVPDHKNNHNIHEKMMGLLEGAAICVADLSDHNANVHFEFGYRLALKLPVIALIEKGQKPLFDVVGYYMVHYDLKKPEVAKLEIEKILRGKDFGPPQLRVTNERSRQNDLIRDYITHHKPKTIDILQLSLATSMKDIFDSIEVCEDLTMRILLMQPGLAADKYSLKGRHRVDVEITQGRIENIELEWRGMGRSKPPTIGLWYYSHEPSMAALIMDDNFVQLGWYWREPSPIDSKGIRVNGTKAPAVLAESESARELLPKVREHFNAVWKDAELVCFRGPKQDKLRLAWKAIQKQ